MTKEKLNGSATSLALAIQGLFEESRAKFAEDLKVSESALIGAVSHDLKIMDEKQSSEMKILWESTQKQIAEGFAKGFANR